ncbi:hypothetical protein K1T71_000961 [Dendrolimus kikuchii]|uniref:Uncharacterized protein n=1 Tax=Dendrolimus kikuchii TaxID=765133 RepID=A0ACC1DGF3_9NEOP|nr:hypothetical protein K1T71_000961 [Dendrolimus kikuchii]
MGIIYAILIFNKYLFVAAYGGSCTFPKDWIGSWFQSGQAELVKINSTHIYNKGTCWETVSKHTFLLYDESDDCYRCIKIHEKHYNVLMYKESHCAPKSSHSWIWDFINEEVTFIGFWLLRKEPKPVPQKCPFHPSPFTFTYNRGTGDCVNPPSRAESCTDDSRLLLRYTACPDMPGTESYDEQLECLATWKEASRTFLVGQISMVQKIKSLQSDEDTYRCFVYPPNYMNGTTEYYVMQSVDASCDILSVPSAGGPVFKFTSVDDDNECQFPDWIVGHNRWFNSTHQYKFTNSNSTIKIIKNSYVEKISSCLKIFKQVDNNYIIVLVRTLVGCKVGFDCSQMFRDFDGTLRILDTETDSSLNHCMGRLNRSSVTILEDMTSTPRIDLSPPELTSLGGTNKEVELDKYKGMEKISSRVPTEQRLDEIERRLNVLEERDTKVESQNLEPKNSITRLESKMNVFSSKVSLIERWITRPLKADL